MDSGSGGSDRRGLGDNRLSNATEIAQEQPVAPQGAEAPREQKLPPNVLRFAPQGATKAKRPKAKAKKAGAKRASSPGSRESEWLKSLLPGAAGGWWDVAEDGKGFKIHFRWRDTGRQCNLPFPRISAEQFQRLKEADIERARFLIADRIYGHLEDLCSPGSDRQDRASAVAERLGLAVGNNFNVIQANTAS